jgi:aryl-alcohol dehydrogenase-like predicted oxidoreductase
LDDLVKQGKILYPAVSNWAAWQIAKALGISSKEGLARFECIQPMYNLVKRQSEVEILPLAESEQIGVITYSPLAAGLLTGKYNGGAKLDQGRFVEHRGTQQRYAEQIYSAAWRAQYQHDTGMATANIRDVGNSTSGHRPNRGSIRKISSKDGIISGMRIFK